MNTIAIPKIKSYNALKTQGVIRHSINLTKKEDFDCGCDEVTDAYAKKLDRISKEAEDGKGISFSNVREMKKYMDFL